MMDTTTKAVEAIAKKITKPPISMSWFGDEAELSAGTMRALAAERDALAAQLADAVDAMIFFLDGYGLDGPEYKFDPEDIEHEDLEWAFSTFRKTLSRITKATP
jgi:hypothetical protein